MTRPPTAADIFKTRGAPPPIEDERDSSVRSLPIMSITPDLRQPRRVIPAIVRGQWDGDPAEMPTLLGLWQAEVEKRLGKRINRDAILKGESDDTIEHKTADPVVDSYFEVLRLAASIHRDGLMNPVRAARRGSSWLLESGERRWVAYHLLEKYKIGDYASIPAVVIDSVDVWKQAAENGARAPLNAIGMARQLALLILDMYADDDGIQFDSYETTVLSGGCDRRFYAQVANGNVFRIKRGMGERVLVATGLKSDAQISQYRALLSATDELWTEADEYNLTENAIRLRMSPDKSPLAIVDTLTPVKVVSANQPLNPPVTTTPNGLPLHQKPTLKVGDKVRFFGKENVIIAIEGKRAFIRGMGYRYLDALELVEEAQPVNAPGAPVQPDPVLVSDDVPEPQTFDEPDELSDGAIMLLKQAHTMLVNGDPRDEGWHLHFSGETQLLIRLGLLELAQRKLVISHGEALCVRITPLGCAAIDKPYVARRAPTAMPVAQETVDMVTGEIAGAHDDTPLIEGWANPPLKPTLQFLMKLSDDLGLRQNWSDFDYLLGVDKQGIAAFHADPKRLADDWRAMLDQRSTRIGDLLDMVAKEITDFITHVYTVGEDVRKGVE
jgi:hypothetical protein